MKLGSKSINFMENYLFRQFYVTHNRLCISLLYLKLVSAYCIFTEIEAEKYIILLLTQFVDCRHVCCTTLQNVVLSSPAKFKHRLIKTTETNKLISICNK
jgi:hypothetical protein